MVISAWSHADAQTLPDPRRKDQLSPQSEILRAFRQDLAACSAITKLLQTDRYFVDSFTPYVNRASKPFTEFLRASPNAKSEAFQYVLRNAKYFEIDVSMHGDAWAVAWVEGEGIYCAPTFARLKAIEALGESAQAWTVRRFFLDKALKSLEHPSNEMASGALVDFDRFKSLVVETHKRYSGVQRSKFVAWLHSTIKEIDGSGSRIMDGAAGLSAAEQAKTLDERIAFLRSLVTC
jgi:hypothetical protein